MSIFFSTFVMKTYPCMDNKEKELLLASSRLLQEWESGPVRFNAPYPDMTSEEKSKTMVYQQQMIQSLQKNFDLMSTEMRGLRDDISKLMSRLAEKEKSLSEKDQILSEKDKLLSAALTEISSLKDQLRLANKNRYGSKSHKGKCVRNQR